MNAERITRLVLLALLLALLAACGAPAGPSIQARDVWARPAMAGSGAQSGESGGMGMAAPGTGALFMRLVNDGREADRLIGGRTDVAQTVEVHETRMEGEVMKMQMLADGLEIPAGGEVMLKPGSYHVMLIGMTRDLKAGDTFSLDLQFEKSGTLAVEPRVREP